MIKKILKKIAWKIRVAIRGLDKALDRGFKNITPDQFKRYLDNILFK
jgi:hypothetical protein